MTTTRDITLRTLLIVVLSILAGAQRSNAQGVGISETSITPDPSAILELQSTTKGFLLPRPTSTPGAVIGMMFYDPAANQINYRDNSAWRIIPSALSKLSFFGSTTSAELAGVISDETGSGLLVFGTAPVFASTVTIGTLTGTTGAINLVGTTSGTVTVKPQDAAGTYNFNLPTGAGTAGQPLLSGGGATAAMTFGTLGVAAGGTGQTAALVSGGVVYGASTTAQGVSAAGSTGQILRSGAGGAPTWSVATYPATAENVGSIMTSNGTDFTSGALSTAATFLGANVVLGANTWADGPTISLGAGTWLVMGTLTVSSPNNTAQRVTGRIWDGTTTYVSSEAAAPAQGGGTPGHVSISLTAFMTLGAGPTTVRLAAVSTVASTIRTTVVDNNPANNTATSIRAVRIGP